jgi:hypothetical protein
MENNYKSAWGNIPLGNGGQKISACLDEQRSAGLSQLDTDCAERQPEIASKLQLLEGVVDRIGAKFQKLAARLEPIRRPIGGQEPKVGHGACPAACKIGSTLEDLIQCLHRISEAIDDVDNTLEI